MVVSEQKQCLLAREIRKLCRALQNGESSLRHRSLGQMPKSEFHGTMMYDPELDPEIEKESDTQSSIPVTADPADPGPSTSHQADSHN